jgi:hypothetical protein
MNRYSLQLRVRPSLYYGSLLEGSPNLAQALEQALVGAVTGELRPALEGGELLDVASRRPTHEQAVNEIAAATERFGYSLIEAEVSEIVDKTVQGILVGACSGGALGLTAKNPYLELFAAIVGAAAGGKAGSMIESVRAKYHYRWFPAAGWVITELPPEELAQGSPQAPQTQPGFPGRPIRPAV